METAVSSLIPAATAALLNGHNQAAAPADWRDDWFVFMCADVSDETAAAITKAGAWPAFMAFFRLLWKRQREAQKAGREQAEAACRAGILNGEGIKGLCRSISTEDFKACPKAMARQLAELQRLGVLAVAKPPAAIVRDKAGRIIRRPTHKGLVPASRIRFNAGDEHKRPANRQGANRPLKVVGGRVSQGAIRHLPGRSPKGRSATTPISPKHISPSAGGQASGIGRPAEDRTRPAAGREAEAPPPAQPWVGPDADRKAATMRRLEAEKAARDAEDAALRQAREANEASSQAPPQDATEAARSLAEAVADLPAASALKARRVARKLSKAERKAESESKALADLIKRRRQEILEDAPGKAAEASAIREATRQKARLSFHATKVAARSPAPAALAREA
jgi:hypothetical protein